MRNSVARFWKKYDHLKVAAGRLATLSSRFQAGDGGVSNLSTGCQLGARCHIIFS